MLLSSLVENIAIISPNGNSLIAITIYRGLDLLRGRSKRYVVRFQLVFSGKPPRRVLIRETSVWNRYTLAAGISTAVARSVFPSYLLENVFPVLFACANGPRARKVLLLPGGYHRQAVDIKDPLYISPWSCGGKILLMRLLICARDI